MSPDLFNLYSERVLRELEDTKGLGGNTINNLPYADDTVLIATSVEQLQILVDRMVLEMKKGLCLNIKKKERMVVTKKKAIPACNIWIHNTKSKQMNWFSYLGSLFTQKVDATGRLNKALQCQERPFQR